ncbi:MAG: hypothetical protein ACRCSB_00820 [Bacteroidales bacterium]
MTKEWNAFESFREAFKSKIAEWQKAYPTVEFVYNSDLDKVTKDTYIRRILVGDNPGKEEKMQGRYFAGRAGKMCETFMRDELEIDMSTAICLNKTPIYTNSTKELAKIDSAILIETQTWMAEQIVALTKVFCDTQLWIIGISQLREGKLFESFCKVLKTELDKDYANKHLFAFKHFSYGAFHKDYYTVSQNLTDAMDYMSNPEDEDQEKEEYDTIAEALEAGHFDYNKHMSDAVYADGTIDDVEEEDEEQLATMEKNLFTPSRELDPDSDEDEFSNELMTLLLIGGTHARDIFDTEWESENLVENL